jgi:archaellum component FlaG (FlaF/FlaG flagellin family)
MKFTEISFSRIKSQVENFLTTEMNKSEILFSPASPQGMIITVITKLFETSMLYLKNTIKQLDLSDVNSNNERRIKNAAITAGHIPTRNISATGTIRLITKMNTDVTEIGGGLINITNKLQLKNKTNNLFYSVNIGSENMVLDVNSTNVFILSIIQGRWQDKIFTGTGAPNQSYQINLRNRQKDIENNNVEVFVDGEYIEIKKHLFELLPNEKSCVVRTGFDGGIDVFFGNGNIGFIPPLSSYIRITYLESDGSLGNIYRRTPNDWTFVDLPLDNDGNSVDIPNLFSIDILSDINYGADREDVMVTKAILPFVSTNFVLGTDRQFAYEIKKLGVFSHVNAVYEDNMIKIFATPNIKLFRDANADYFSVNKEAWILDEYEKLKLKHYLRNSGNIMLSERFEIIAPTLSYYALNVFVIPYSDYISENLTMQINSVISDYFLNLSRTGRIPKSDLIDVLLRITDIHSVDVSFTCKKNEDYHRNYTIQDENKKNEFYYNNMDNYIVDAGYNPETVIGIDKVLGDMILENNEYPILRGGWLLRNNLLVSDNINDKTGYKAVNVIIKDTVDSSKKPRTKINI